GPEPAVEELLPERGSETILLVFDQQNRFRTALRQQLLDGRFGTGIAGVPRQKNAERRPSILLAVNPDASTGLLDDSTDDGEPESGAASRILRREKRIVDAIANVCRDPRAGIADHER